MSSEQSYLSSANSDPSSQCLSSLCTTQSSSSSSSSETISQRYSPIQQLPKPIRLLMETYSPCPPIQQLSRPLMDTYSPCAQSAALRGNEGLAPARFPGQDSSSPRKSVHFKQGSDDVSEYEQSVDSDKEFVPIRCIGATVKALAQNQQELTEQKVELESLMNEWNDKIEGLSTTSIVYVMTQALGAEEALLLKVRRRFDRRLQRLLKSLKQREDYLDENARDLEEHRMILKDMEKRWKSDYKFVEELDDASKRRMEELIGCINKWHQELDENEAQIAKVNKMKNELNDVSEWFEATHPRTIQQIIDSRRRRLTIKDDDHESAQILRLLNNNYDFTIAKQDLFD